MCCACPTASPRPGPSRLNLKAGASGMPQAFRSPGFTSGNHRSSEPERIECRRSWPGAWLCSSRRCRNGLDPRHKKIPPAEAEGQSVVARAGSADYVMGSSVPSPSPPGPSHGRPNRIVRRWRQGTSEPRPGPLRSSAGEYRPEAAARPRWRRRCRLAGLGVRVWRPCRGRARGQRSSTRIGTGRLLCRFGGRASFPPPKRWRQVLLAP